MKCLLVASTDFEIQPILARLKIPKQISRPGDCISTESLDVLISGVGPLHAATHVATTLSRSRYDLLLNFGIAGSMDPLLTKLTLVHVICEMSDVGAETPERNIDLFEMGLQGKNDFPYIDGELRVSSPALTALEGILQVRSLTVHRALGRKDSIGTAYTRYRPHITNMEGAAVFYARKSVSNDDRCISVRSISNMVGVRDKRTWDIPGAIRVLCAKGLEILDELRVLP